MKLTSLLASLFDHSVRPFLRFSGRAPRPCLDNIVGKSRLVFFYIQGCFLQIFLYTSGTRSSVKNLQNTSTNGTYCHGSSPASRNPFKDVLNSDIFMVERKLAMRLLTIVIIWLLGWTPFAVVALIQLLGYGQYVSKYVSLMCMIVCKSSSVINAYTYGMR